MYRLARSTRPIESVNITTQGACTVVNYNDASVSLRCVLGSIFDDTYEVPTDFVRCLKKIDLKEDR